MKRLFALGLGTLLSVTSALNAPAEEKSDNPLADAPTQYSADLVVTRKVGAPLSMRVYVDGNKRRTEEGTNGGGVIILRGDIAKRYILNTANKTYVELPLNPLMVESTADWAKRLGVVHEKMGTEDVNGETCDKYRYTADAGKMPAAQNKKVVPRVPRPLTGFIWVSQSNHMLVKSESEGSTAEWKNVKVGPPDESLFEVPADYKKQEGPNLAPRPSAEEEKSGEEKPSGEKSNNDKSDGQKSDDQKSGGEKQE